MDSLQEDLFILFNYVQENPNNLLSPVGCSISQGAVTESEEVNYDEFLPTAIKKQDDTQKAVFLAGATAINFIAKTRTGKSIAPKTFLEYFSSKCTKDLFSAYEITNRLLCSMLEQCLVVDAKRRPSIKEILEHLYFHQDELPFSLLTKIKEKNGSFVYNKKKSSFVYLSEGSFGIVGLSLKKPKLKKMSKLRFYVKKIIKFDMDKYPKEKAVREIKTNKFIRENDIEGCIQSFEEKEMREESGFKIRMQYYPGIELQKLVKMYQIFTEDEVRQIMTPIAKGLTMLHTNEIIYRDLKPANMLVGFNKKTNQMEGKIIDFGTAKDVSKELAITIAGTVATMAPEVHKNNGVYDINADIFSFGLIIYTLLLGTQLPVSATYAASDYQKVITISKERKLSLAAIDLIEKCIQFDPTQRISTMDEVLKCDFFNPKSKNAKNCLSENTTINMNKKAK